MTIIELAAKLQTEIEKGNGGLQAVCDYPLGFDGYQVGEWSTIESVSKMTAGGNYLKSPSDGIPKDVIYLDWRC